MRHAAELLGASATKARIEFDFDLNASSCGPTATASCKQSPTSSRTPSSSPHPAEPSRSPPAASATPRLNSKSTTPAAASPPTNSNTSSAASNRWTPQTRAPWVAPASASPSAAPSSPSTAVASGPKANQVRAQASCSPSQPGQKQPALAHRAHTRTIRINNCPPPRRRRNLGGTAPASLSPAVSVVVSAAGARGNARPSAPSPLDSHRGRPSSAQ